MKSKYERLWEYADSMSRLERNRVRDLAKCSDKIDLHKCMEMLQGAAKSALAWDLVASIALHMHDKGDGNAE